ncbi:MAG: HDIG domain-containing protein [Deltaproteobacteria bacterium]|nr:HDIG domain-containing protein [Deltaproteobacteria bacterium]
MDEKIGPKPRPPPSEAAKTVESKSTDDGLGSRAELNSDDASFVAIRSESFVLGNKSAFDVFVKISSGRFLKLLQAGDGFTPDRLENYINKGVTHFYIKKEAEESYRNYSETITAAVLGSKKLSHEIKLGQIFNQGTMVMGFLKDQGVTEANLQCASKFIGSVKELVIQLNFEKSDVLSGFFSNVATAEHGVGTSLLAGILAHVLEIRMDRPVQIVGMASLLHDIGLAKLPEALWSEDQSKMSEKEKALFRAHPTLGADLVRDIGHFDPAAIQAIEQHHMRLHGVDGFPEKKTTIPLPRVSEIVGICEEFNWLIQRAKKHSGLSILSELEKSVFPGFSRQIVYAFRTAFFPKK